MWYQPPGEEASHMAMSQERTRRRSNRKDISIIEATRQWGENPAFIQTAMQLGNYVCCGACGKVMGIGINLAAAESDVHRNRTGTYSISDGTWRCNADSPAQTSAN